MTSLDNFIRNNRKSTTTASDQQLLNPQLLTWRKPPSILPSQVRKSEGIRRKAGIRVGGTRTSHSPRRSPPHPHSHKTIMKEMALEIIVEGFSIPPRCTRSWGELQGKNKSQHVVIASDRGENRRKNGTFLW